MNRATTSLREQIAHEAARLLWAGAETDVSRARERAARRILRTRPLPRHLPSGAEVAARLERWSLIADVPADERRSRELRLDALWILRSLRRFRPVLVESECDDRIHHIELEPDRHSDTNLQSVLDELAAAGLEGEDGGGGTLVVGQRHRFRLSFRPSHRASSSSRPEMVDEGSLTEALRRECPWLALDAEHPSPRSLDRSLVYRQLLEPLDDLKLDPFLHPEGNALYHSLQVFDLISRESPYDSELLAAALLHMVGRAIDPAAAAEAGAEALEGVASDRTSELIRTLPDACAALAGNLGGKGRQRLREHPDREELELLAAADLKGRQVGVAVSELDEALAHLREFDSYEDSEG
jgi:hypothetical protein